MIEIHTTKGIVTFIDDCDVDLNEVNWYVGSHGYVFRRTKTNPDELMSVSIMERILGRRMLKGELVDHKNGNRLDNTRGNLRVVDRFQNAWNSCVRSHSLSQLKGVRLHVKGRWQARITFNKKEIGLGYFDTPEEAAIAYNNAALKYFGEYARLNNIPSSEL